MVCWVRPEILALASLNGKKLEVQLSVRWCSLICVPLCDCPVLHDPQLFVLSMFTDKTARWRWWLHAGFYDMSLLMAWILKIHFPNFPKDPSYHSLWSFSCGNGKQTIIEKNSGPSWIFHCHCTPISPFLRLKFGDPGTTTITVTCEDLSFIHIYPLKPHGKSMNGTLNFFRQVSMEGERADQRRLGGEKITELYQNKGHNINQYKS